MGEFKLRCPKLPRRASNYSLNTTLAITCAIKKFFFFFMQRFAGVVSINIHGAWNIKGEYLSAFIFLRIIKKMAQDVEQLVYTVLISFQCFPLIPKSRKYMYLAVENLF